MSTVGCKPMPDEEKTDASTKRPFFHCCFWILFFKLAVSFVCYGFEPFVGGVFSRNFKSEVGKPTVSSGTVPMLDVGRNVYHVSGQHLYGRLSFFLIPAASGYTN